MILLLRTNLTLPHIFSGRRPPGCLTGERYLQLNARLNAASTISAASSDLGAAALRYALQGPSAIAIHLFAGLDIFPGLILAHNHYLLAALFHQATKGASAWTATVIRANSAPPIRNLLISTLSDLPSSAYCSEKCHLIGRSCTY
jgi:hypothetical protein